jgi:hypothetical protein
MLLRSSLSFSKKRIASMKLTLESAQAGVHVK